MPTNNDIYVWYSAATDVTGKRLMEALDCAGGSTKPAGDKIVICWGTKTKEPIKLANKTVFNHPNAIRTNRNKFESLKEFDKGGCRVAAFTEDFGKAGGKGFEYPVIARTRYHQGGKGFWFCANKAMVDNALHEGAQYMQRFIDIKDEYRLHVVGDKVVYAVKKVRRDNHREAFEKDWSDQIKNYATKNEVNLDEEQLNFILKRISRKEATGTDMIIRSNSRGWKFIRVDLNKLDKTLAAEAVKAVKAVGLTYGAVDCCIDTDGNACIIECNTGPGLEGSTLKAWVAELKKLVKDGIPKKVAAAPAANAMEAAAAKQGKSLAKMTAREKLKLKTELMSQMVDVANDDELAVVEGLFAKMV